MKWHRLVPSFHVDASPAQGSISIPVHFSLVNKDSGDLINVLCNHLNTRLPPISVFDFFDGFQTDIRQVDVFHEMLISGQLTGIPIDGETCPTCYEGWM